MLVRLQLSEMLSVTSSWTCRMYQRQLSTTGCIAIGTLMRQHHRIVCPLQLDHLELLFFPPLVFCNRQVGQQW